jgi:hypothetical protein
MELDFIIIVVVDTWLNAFSKLTELYTQKGNFYYIFLGETVLKSKIFKSMSKCKQIGTSSEIFQNPSEVIVDRTPGPSTDPQIRKFYSETQNETFKSVL